MISEQHQNIAMAPSNIEAMPPLLITVEAAERSFTTGQLGFTLRIQSGHLMSAPDTYWS